MAVSMTTDFAIPTTGFAIPVSAPVASSARDRSSRLRRITPQAGHALEILGHAIEYLADELVHCGREVSPTNGDLQAVQLLMAVNRQVYYECPEVVTMSERLRSMLHLRVA